MSRDEHLDANLLETPWEIVREPDYLSLIRVYDRRGRPVAAFKNEDVAALVCQLVNAIPPEQATANF